MEITLKKIDDALETIYSNKERILSNCSYSAMKRQEQEINNLILGLGTLKKTILKNETLDPDNISERLEKLTNKLDFILK